MTRFRVLGFPVHVRPGFLAFLGLVVIVNGTDLGLWLAGCIAVFTLLHELGHALAARATGARAEISLDFLYGYASFEPTRELKGWERAGISLAGPATQIVLSVATMLALGLNPISRHDVRSSSAAIALFWAGPVIGLFNLVPVLPFDGGNIVLAGAERLFPRRAKVVMTAFSIAITSAAIVAVMLHPRLRPFAMFAVIPLIAQLQLLNFRPAAARRRENSSATPFADAEAQAWRTGDVSGFVPGQQPSPWFVAHQQLQLGRRDVATAVLLADFVDTEEPNWWPPETAPESVLAELVKLLPLPLPTGRSFSEFALSNVLLRLGQYEYAVHYAAACYSNHRSPMLAMSASRGAAALGDKNTSLAWLRAAVGDRLPSEGLRNAVAVAPEFEQMRDDPQFVAIVAPERIRPASPTSSGR